MPNSIESLIVTTRENKDRLDCHQDEIQVLKDGHEALNDWRKEIDTWRSQSDENYKDLKLTIVNENRDTRNFFQTIMQNQWDFIKSATGMQHELKKSDIEIKKENQAKMWEFAVKIIGAGGIGFLLIERFFLQ